MTLIYKKSLVSIFLFSSLFIVAGCITEVQKPSEGKQSAENYSLLGIELTHDSAIESSGKVTAKVLKDEDAVVADELYINIKGESDLVALEVDSENSVGNSLVYVGDATGFSHSTGKSGSAQLESCTIQFAGVGQECGNWGECPERSLLGGRTWFCVCLDSCTIF